MHDLEYLGKELKSSSNGSSLPPICIFLLALLTPAACFSLHLLIPGGLVHSHLLVANSLSLLLCCAHLVLFMLIHNDGMRLKQRGASSIYHQCMIPFSLLLDAFFSLGAFFFSVPMFHVTAVLFGAQVVSQFWETLSWSFLMSSLSVLPAAMLLGSHPRSWIKVFVLCRFSSYTEWCAYIITVATVLGAWMGAFFIPLDWNQPWQVWPIPCCTGAVIGNTTALIVSALHDIFFPNFESVGYLY